MQLFRNYYIQKFTKVLNTVTPCYLLFHVVLKEDPPWQGATLKLPLVSSHMVGYINLPYAWEKNTTLKHRCPVSLDRGTFLQMYSENLNGIVGEERKKKSSKHGKSGTVEKSDKTDDRKK